MRPGRSGGMALGLAGRNAGRWSGRMLLCLSRWNGCRQASCMVLTSRSAWVILQGGAGCIHGPRLLSLLLRHRAHALTDAVLGLLSLAACDSAADGLAPDPRVSAAGAGDAHNRAPAGDKCGGPQACPNLGQGGRPRRRESGALFISRKKGPVIGGLLELRRGPLQMPQVSLKLLLQQVVEVSSPPV